MTVSRRGFLGLFAAALAAPGVAKATGGGFIMSAQQMTSDCLRDEVGCGWRTLALYPGDPRPLIIQWGQDDRLGGGKYTVTQLSGMLVSEPLTLQEKRERRSGRFASIAFPIVFPSAVFTVQVDDEGRYVAIGA